MGPERFLKPSSGARPLSLGARDGERSSGRAVSGNLREYPGARVTQFLPLALALIMRTRDSEHSSGRCASLKSPRRRAQLESCSGKGEG